MLRLVLAALLSVGPVDSEVPAPPTEPTPIDLTWTAPPDCPGADRFVAAMQELVGHELVLSPEAELEIIGVVVAAPGGYTLTLQLRSPQREESRELAAAGCDELIDAGSVVVVTRLLSTATKPPPDEEPVPEEPIEPPPPRAPTEPVAVEPRSTVPPPPAGEPSSVRFAASVLGGAAFGLLPRIAGSLRGGVAVLAGPARAELFAQHLFARTTTDDFEIRVGLTRFGGLGCWTPYFGRLDLALCGGVELGLALGSGTGSLPQTEISRQLWVAVPLEAGLAWSPVPRLALRALGGAAIAVRRPGFHLRTANGPDHAFRLGSAGVYALAGLELRLP